jgi:hypothetical protein
MKKIKDIIKKNPEPARGTNFVNPSQLGQYSATNQVAESATLNQYLSAKGINPKFVSTATKIAHSKSAAFLKWQRDHMRNEDMTKVKHDGDARSKDSDSPTRSRANELKKSTHFHTVKPVHTHKEGSQTPMLTPEETINEISMKDISPAMQAHVKKGRTGSLNLGTRMASTKPAARPKAKPRRSFFKSLFAGEEVQKTKPSALEKFRKAAAEREKKHKEIEKNSGGMTAAIDRLQKQVNKEEVEQIDELKKSTVFSWLKQQPVVAKKKPGMDKKAHNQRIKTHTKSWNRALDRLSGYKPTSEDTFADTKAASQTVNSPGEISEKKRQMSKSARMIKALYKKHRMVKEDMYDHEKEDKSVATYGKKPKMDKADKKDNEGEKKPAAAATLTGGSTLTGSKRDDIEIDPMMRNRPGQPDITKKDDKKDGKKEDKKKDK